jgi:vacuolar protein sorting-associated protein 45
MDIAQAVSGYIAKMVSVGDSTSGTQGAKMKALLLDRDTVGLLQITMSFSIAHVLKVAIVSTATTQSTLLNHEIYLTEYGVSPFTHLN